LARQATFEPFADTLAKTAGSPAELAAASDLVCVWVQDDADVEVIAGTGVLPGLARGVVAVHLELQRGRATAWLLRGLSECGQCR
jgi:3-hydroxyisobutyrate dehydrogenase